MSWKVEFTPRSRKDLQRLSLKDQRRILSQWVTGLLGLAAATLAAGPALAKPARCFTTEDGHYVCDFKILDRNGSFRITAPDYPIFDVIVESPGLARGYINAGNRFIMMPGMYHRQADDGACWQGDSDYHRMRICAW